MILWCDSGLFFGPFFFLNRYLCMCCAIVNSKTHLQCSFCPLSVRHLADPNVDPAHLRCRSCISFPAHSDGHLGTNEGILNVAVTRAGWCWDSELEVKLVDHGCLGKDFRFGKSRGVLLTKASQGDLQCVNSSLSTEGGAPQVTEGSLINMGPVLQWHLIRSTPMSRPAEMTWKTCTSLPRNMEVGYLA